MALAEVARSGRVPTVASRRRRALDVGEQEGVRPARQRPRVGHRSGASGRRSVAVGFGQVAQPAGQPAQDRQGDARLLEQDGLEVPGREGEAGRRAVGDDLGEPRLPVEDRQLAEEVARAEPRDSLAVADDPDRARRR